MPVDHLHGTNQMSANIESTAKMLVAEHRDGKTFHTIEGIADLAAAYQVQKVYVGEAIGSDQIAGYKIGLTSQRMQAMCGIDQPIAGAVFKRRVMKSGASVRIADYHHLGLEFEICARLGRDLEPRKTPYTRDEAARAVDAVCAAIELIDDRHADYAVLDCNRWLRIIRGTLVPCLVPLSSRLRRSMKSSAWRFRMARKSDAAEARTRSATRSSLSPGSLIIWHSKATD